MKTRIFFLLVLFFRALTASSQLTVSWSENYVPPPGFGFSIKDAIKNVNGNVIILADQVNILTNDRDPLLIRFDAVGNSQLLWTINNQNLDQFSRQISTDSAGNIYILSYFVSTMIDSSSVVKIDGVTGQVIFNLVFPEYISAIKVNSDKFYVVVGDFSTNFSQFNLQGNLIWTVPLSGFLQFHKIHCTENKIYLIGNRSFIADDSIVVEQYNDSGVFTWAYSYDPTHNIDPYIDPILDSELDQFDNVWITGYYTGTGSNGYLVAINDSGIQFDSSMIGAPSIGHNKLATDHSGKIYLLYLSASTSSCEILKFNNFSATAFASIDSAYVGARETDIALSDFTNIITVDDKRGPQGFSGVTDYEINLFDTSGTLLDNLTYSNGSFTTEYAYKLLADSNAVYVIGTMRDSAAFGTYNVNVLKIDVVTSVPVISRIHKSVFLFPNPNSGNEVHTDVNMKDAEIRIYDIYGRLVQSSAGISGNHFNINRNIRSGIFTVLIDGEEKYTGKVLIY